MLNHVVLNISPVFPRKHVTELRMSNVKVLSTGNMSSSVWMIRNPIDVPKSKMFQATSEKIDRATHPVGKSQTQSLSALLIKRSQKTRDNSWYHSLGPS